MWTCLQQCWQEVWQKVESSRCAHPPFVKVILWKVPIYTYGGTYKDTTAALWTEDKKKNKPPTCPLAGERNKTRLINTMQYHTAVTMNSIYVYQKPTLCPGNLLKRNENICPHNNMYTNVYSSIVHNSQKVETTHMSVNWWTDKQIVVCPYNGILQHGQTLKTLRSVKVAIHKRPHMIWFH